MVLFDCVKLKRYVFLSFAFISGVVVGGGSMIYLFTIPDVIKLAALQVSQVYVLTAFGILFFSMSVGVFAALFVKAVLFGEIL